MLDDEFFSDETAPDPDRTRRGRRAQRPDPAAPAGLLARLRTPAALVALLGVVVVVAGLTAALAFAGAWSSKLAETAGQRTGSGATLGAPTSGTSTLGPLPSPFLGGATDGPSSSAAPSETASEPGPSASQPGQEAPPSDAPAPAPEPVQPAPVPVPPPVVQPTVYYKNCGAVRSAGIQFLYRGMPGYGPHLDHDGDGIACN